MPRGIFQLVKPVLKSQINEDLHLKEIHSSKRIISKIQWQILNI